MNQFKNACTDLRNRMNVKNSGIYRKHEMQTSNVDLTKNILREYRDLKKEETHLKQIDKNENLERERERIREIKERVLNKESEN